MAKFDLDESMVRKLAELLDEAGLTEIEYKVGEHAIRVCRQSSENNSYTGVIPSTAAHPVDNDSEIIPDNRTGAVTSPMVGVVYLSPEPGAPPFIAPGDTVGEGQTLLLIEAMKTFNHVRAPKEGRVVEICVSDQSPVEFGEELVIIE
tara:strand:+ start:107 stop:550 length:444 start_codon:yes stop_codon:yes gene_type:complete